MRFIYLDGTDYVKAIPDSLYELSKGIHTNIVAIWMEHPISTRRSWLGMVSRSIREVLSDK